MSEPFLKYDDHHEQILLSLILHRRIGDGPAISDTLKAMSYTELYNAACDLLSELAKHYPECDDCLQARIYRLARGECSP